MIRILHNTVLKPFVVVICLSFPFFPASLLAGSDSWTSLGPYGGIILDMAIDPSDPDIVWAVSRYGGLFKTTDGGNNWVRLTTDLPDISQWSSSWAGNCIIALNSTTLLLGGGFGAVTVYKSMDGGASWSVSDTGLPYDPHRFAVAKTGSPQPIYAATNHGIYVSRDSGATWSADNSGALFNINMVSVAVDPNDEDIVWAGNSEGTLWLRSGSNNGTGIWTEETGSAQYARAIVMPSSTLVYAGDASPTGTNPSRRGSKTTNWTWANMNLDSGDPELEHFRGGDFNPTDTTEALAGSEADIYRTTDSGLNWSPIIQEPLDRGFATVKFSGDGTRAYASSGLVDYNDSPFFPGVLRIDAPGSGTPTWKNNGLDTIGVQVIRQHPVNTSVLAAGTRHGFFLSQDGGLTWLERNGSGTDVLEGADVTGLVMDSADPDTMFVCIAANGIYQTNDRGLTWQYENSLGNLHQMLIDPHASPTRLYLALDSAMGTYVPSTMSYRDLDIMGDGSSANVKAIAVHPTTAGKLFAAVFGEGIFVTVDDGANWQKADSNTINGTVITINPHDTETIYTAEYDSDSGYTSFYRSTNGGASWSRLHRAMDWGEVNAIAVDSVNPAGLYLATTQNGIWVSGDEGRSWERAPGSLPVAANDVIADRTATQKIYAGTSQGSLYENTLSNLPVGTQSRIWALFMSAILSNSSSSPQ